MYSALTKLMEKIFDPEHVYFSLWTYHLKLEIMELIIELGFELELYGLYEYPMMYLYVETNNHNFNVYLTQLVLDILNIYWTPRDLC